VFTAGANGSYLQRLIARPAGTNIASVLRVFLNNGSTNATAANNVLITEATLPASTGALVPVELPLNFAIPAAYVLNVTLGTTVATGYYITVLAGNY
jgi:hypothetical protein